MGSQRVLRDDQAACRHADSTQHEASAAFNEYNQFYQLLALPAFGTDGRQMGLCQHTTTPSCVGGVYSPTNNAFDGLVGPCFPSHVTFVVGAAGTAADWPPDAESCCGNSVQDVAQRLAEVSELEGERLPSVSQSARDAHAISQDAVDSQPVFSRSACGSKRQRLCSHVSGQSSGHCSTEEVLLMGDDFECMDSEEASKLLDDATMAYPGGVDAALADMYAACSQEQPLSASAGPAAGASTAIMGCVLDTKPACAGQGCYYQHQYQHQHGVTVPSLTAVVQTATPPPCYAPNIMLPCCQWSAFSDDPVGAVLAGREPAAKYLAPCGSCCSSGGLTDCLMQLDPA